MFLGLDTGTKEKIARLSYNPMNKKIYRKRWIIAFLCALASIFLAIFVFSEKDIRFDLYAYTTLVENMRGKGLTFFFQFITHLAGIAFLVAAAIGCFIFIKNRTIAWLIPVNLILCAALNLALKLLIQRPRPHGYMLVEETGFSFPSGHSMASLAFYGFFIYLIHVKVKNRNIRWISTVLLVLLILLIGISRVYLGVHYASDVIAGFSIALAYLIVFCTVISGKVQNEIK